MELFLVDLSEAHLDLLLIVVFVLKGVFLLSLPVLVTVTLLSQDKYDPL